MTQKPPSDITLCESAILNIDTCMLSKKKMDTY